MNRDSNLIDVRSDTVTRPTDAMRKAMYEAEVGDDVYGDDPTVNRLQDMCAEMLGFEQALFMASGTQSNLVALLTHCQRGDEYIVGADAHTYKYEGGGAAALGGIQPQTIPFGENGELPLDQVQEAVKPVDVHFASTRLLCLENSQHGRVQSVDYMHNARTIADANDLLLHLDGARMANASVAAGVSLAEISKPFHTVSLCLSKGLGAPVGSILLGDQDFITRARRWRKVTGGGMRQAGVLAAAGILAITEGYDRLHEDHDNAKMLADLLRETPGMSVRNGWTQTNMVWMDFEGEHGTSLPEYAMQHGVRMSARRNAGRLVMHNGITSEDVKTVADVVKSYFEKAAG